MPQWSKQQLEAIETVDKNITVSASAGAGKTTVLVNRILKRIQEDGLKVNQILAMTFTSAAAMEMKKRLMGQLQDRISKCNDEAMKTILQEQLTLLPIADICTIDAFCLKILKNYSYVLEQDPSRFLNIFDENALSHFRKQALTQALTKQYALHNPILIQLLETLSSVNDQHESLKKFVEQLAKEASKQEKPLDWLESLKMYYQKFDQIDQLPENIQYYFYTFYIEDILYLENLANDFLQFVKTIKEEAEIFDQYIQSLHIYFQQMLDSLYKHDYFKFRETVEIANTVIKCPDCRKVTGKPMKDLPEYKEYRDQIHKFLDKLCMEELESEKSIVTSISNQKEMASLLITLTQDYLLAFMQLKLDANGIDFEDMERYAKEILQKNNGEIATILRDQYVDIMVDEYQDSNDLQENIIQAICRENNVFRVGDVKQSIYSFRNAKPALMRGIIQNQTENDKVIYLSNNYRSKFNIVDFNNAIFDGLMNIPTFQDTYSEMDAVSIGTDTQKENDHSIELKVLCKKSIHEEDNSFGENELKAEYIAHRIIDMQKHSEFTNWKDYVVLTRTHAPKAFLKKAFDKYNIPCHITTTSGYFEDEAVLAVLAWLKYLQNPADEISLLSILTSAYYRMSDEDLTQLKLNKKSLTYFQYLQQIQHPFVQDYEYFKQNLATWSVVDCVNAIFCLHQFYDNKTTETQKNNLDSLFEMAISCVEKQESLNDFIHIISISEQKDMGDAVAISDSANVVKVITVHGSKGLEFPVVFYWSSDIKRRRVQTIFTDDEIGFAFDDIQLPQRFRKKTLLRKIIERKQLVSSLEEELRILYVALTRPKKKLIIVDVVNEPKLIPSKISYQVLVNNPQISSLVLAALRKNPRDYVQTEHVVHMWKTNSVRYKELQEKVILPTFNQIVQTIDTIRPSLLEEHSRTGLSLRSVSATSRGTLLHKAMEFINFKEKNIDSISFDLSTYDKNKIKKFFEHPMYKEIENMEIYKEYPFYYKGEQVIKGIMDCVCISNNQVFIIDFKSDRNITKEELIERYHLQIQTYKQVMEIAYPTHTISCYIYSFELNDWILIK